MPELDPVGSSPAIPRTGPDARREPRPPVRKPRRERPRDELTDDHGERRDEEPPLIDDYA